MATVTSSGKGDRVTSKSLGAFIVKRVYPSLILSFAAVLVAIANIYRKIHNGCQSELSDLAEFQRVTNRRGASEKVTKWWLRGWEVETGVVG